MPMPCNRPIVTPPIKKRVKKDEKPVPIRCTHCHTYTTTPYSNIYCGVMCFREAFFGSPWWQDTH